MCLILFIFQRFTGIEGLHLFANISGSMERSRNEVAWQICGRAVMFDPYQAGAPTPIMHELQLSTNHLISNISRIFTRNPNDWKHQTCVYDAKFSAISIKVESIYFRKNIGKIGIKDRKKIGRKNTLDTGLQSTSQYICFPIFSYVFPICIFGPCFFLCLNPIFLIFPIFSYF